MRIIDLHCYPNTEPWIKSRRGSYVEALAKYWNRAWTAKSEAEVIEEFKAFCCRGGACRVRHRIVDRRTGLREQICGRDA